jgi:mono/diheme cytochrome c family protein
MRDPHRVFLLATVLFVATGSTIAMTQGAKGRTVWDGVYTDAQAERATAVFSQSCARCHSLTADPNSRPLTGEKFWQGYTQKTVGDLLKFVSANMPNGNGGSLSASAYHDLVALILKSNGFPAGKTEIAADTIADVQIVPKDGPGELPANVLVRVVGCLAPKAGSDWTLTSATAPQRIEKTGPTPEDATRALGDRTVTLKFVLTRLDTFVGQRMSVSGMLMGTGGAEGINVATVNKVADTCP